MSDAAAPTITRGEGGRCRCTLVFSAADTKAAEERALVTLGARMDFKGFRPGRAPAALVRARVAAETLSDETVRQLMGDALPALIGRERLQPIIPPRVEVVSRDPLTIHVTIIEKPPVTVRDSDTLRIGRKTVAADPKDIERTIHAILPDPSDAAILQKIGMSSADEVRQAVTRFLTAQVEQTERERREQALFDELKKRTQVTLAEELVDEELRALVEEWQEQLENRNMTIADWLKREKKTMEDVEKDLRGRAEDRLRLRFGIAKVIEEKKIAVTLPEMAESTDASRQLHWQLLVEKAVEMLLKQQ